MRPYKHIAKILYYNLKSLNKLDIAKEVEYIARENPPVIEDSFTNLLEPGSFSKLDPDSPFWSSLRDLGFAGRISRVAPKRQASY